MALYQRTIASLGAIRETPIPGDLTASATEAESPNWGDRIIGISLLLIGLVIGLVISSDVQFIPPAGIGAFAVFYVIALVAERVLEIIDPIVEKARVLFRGLETKPTLELERNKAIEEANKSTEPQVLQKAADAQVAVDNATRVEWLSWEGWQEDSASS